MLISGNEHPDLSGRLFNSKKRKIDLDSSMDIDSKRLKQDLDVASVRRQAANIPSVARRPALAVAEDIILKVTAGDRQMAFHLLREFSVEHLPSVQCDLNQLSSMFIHCILGCKYEQISVIMLKMLFTILQRASVLVWEGVARCLFEASSKYESLFEESILDGHLLLILSGSLDRRCVSQTDIPSRVSRCAERALRSSSSTFSRTSAIRYLVSRTLSSDCVTPATYASLESSLCQMTSDCDARVRSSAVDGLVALSERSDGLSILAYDTVKMLMHDADRHVRIEVMRIILTFANKIPLQEVSNANGSQDRLPLCDDAFSIICHGINDMEVMVRAEAATLLGKFTVVSDSCLDQTLDKKLMRTIKTTRGAVVKRESTSMFALTKTQKNDGARWKSWQSKRKDGPVTSKTSNEWASGKDLNAPAPSGDSTTRNDNDADSIIPQGACGSFVTALEDEFMAVRKAAVYSLGRLAAHRPSFATTALDHLTDMFNDEIAEVRLDAIFALTPLVVHGQLQKEQLEIILKCLDDAMYESRQALRELLAKGELADVDCMKLTTRALINCLQRFPSDKDQIFVCMSELGSRHGVFVHSMVRGLLDLHPIFETQEQQIDDVFYTAKLILVLNAAAHHEPIVSMLPAYVLKHYRFIRAAMPNLVAPIKIVDAKQMLKQFYSKSSLEENEFNNTDILLRTYERLRDVNREHSLSERNCLRRFIVEDAKAISSFNATLSGSARFLATISELSAALESIQQTVLCGGDLSCVQDAIKQEMLRVHCAQYQFTGVESNMMSYLIEAILHLSLLSSMVMLMRSPESYSHIIQDIRSAIDYVRGLWVATDTASSEPVLTLIASILNTVDNIGVDRKKIITHGSLGQLILNHGLELPFTVNNLGDIHSKWAHIREPAKDVALEKPIRFVAGLPTSVKFLATLYNFSHGDIASLRIQVDYPDNSRTIFRPRLSDFIHNDESTTVSTKVLMSSTQTWLDSALAKLTLVLLIESSLQIVPVPGAPGTQENATIRVRLHPMNRA